MGAAAGRKMRRGENGSGGYLSCRWWPVAMRVVLRKGKKKNPLLLGGRRPPCTAPVRLQLREEERNAKLGFLQ
jgi:hypothetical protein